MLIETTHEAFGVTATEIHYEPTQADVLVEADEHVIVGCVDEQRVAQCPVYRAAVLTAYQARVSQLERHVSIYKTAYEGKQQCSSNDGPLYWSEGYQAVADEF